MLGIGAMLGQLCGNADSVAAFTAGLNKEIQSLTLGEDDALHFVFTDGYKMRIEDDGQSCCEHRYMQTDDDLSHYVGATLLDAVIETADNVGDSEYGDHEVQFLKVETSKGVFTMASHNEHNGYYGGFCIRVKAE